MIRRARCAEDTCCTERALVEELRALHGRASTPYPRNAPATDLANGAVWARPLRRIDARDDGTGTTNTR